MSRYTYNLSLNPRINLSFGHDHALGYFYDIFDEDEEEMIEEKCSLFDNLTGAALAELLKAKIKNVETSRYGKMIPLLRMDMAI